MTDNLLPCVEIEPVKTAEISVIWLHGLGADGYDFEPVVPALQLPESLPVRFIFPHAPQRPVTINSGLMMPAWYDILEMSIERKIDTQALLESSSQIVALIERELERGIPAERIILAGFSQGGDHRDAKAVSMIASPMCWKMASGRSIDCHRNRKEFFL